MLRKLYLYGLLTCLFSFSSYAEDTAKLLFEQSAPMVFQIKVIDKASGNKSTIGSGFQISSAGVLATNYHVVSDYILEREKYSIEVLDHEYKSMKASLVNFDIVHDLALLKVAELNKPALILSQSELSHGNRIYSMGNPNDLGMTIIEGTYNGMVEASRYQKYLFSGSLNAGMSGGPVLMRLEDYTSIKNGKPVKHLGAYRIVLVGVHSGQPRWDLIDRRTGEVTETISHSLVHIWFSDLILEILSQVQSSQ